MSVIVKYLRLFYCIVFLFSITGEKCNAQGEANNWFFGLQEGITFNPGSPQNIPCPNNLGVNGTAVASDSAGNLLFYTDGLKVYTRTHQLMQNGDGLLGTAYYQSCITFPKPGSKRYYYIFVVGNYLFTPWTGLRYSLVDIEANGGEGKVVYKNYFLAGGNNAMDVLTATLHRNNRDIWVVTRKQSVDKYTYASYLVTPSGISDPVYSVFKKTMTGMQSQLGAIRISPDGKKFLASQFDDNLFGYFDNQLGTITRLCSQLDLFSFSIGTEFSPASKYVYVCGASTQFDFFVVYQFDANAIDSLAFINSQKVVGFIANPTGGSTGLFLMMQAAVDGKIYGIRWGHNKLFTLNYPEESGNASGFQYDGYDLNGIAGKTLPQFVTSYVQRFFYQGSCVGLPYTFTSNFHPVPDSIHWDFGDGGSSNDLNPTHIYGNSGNYSVVVFARFPDGRTGDAQRDIVVAALPEPDLGPDVTVCKGTSVQLFPGSFSSYTWNTGYSDSTLLAADTGQYWVQVANESGCVNRDTMNIHWYPQALLDPSNLNIAPTTCGGTTGAITGLNISGNLPYSVQWIEKISGNIISDSLDIYHLTVGLYELHITDANGCTSIPASYAIQDAGNLLIDTAFANKSSCNNLNGSVSVSAVSGLGSMLHYFLKAGNDTLSQWSNGLFSGLTEGTYYTWVSDSSGCSSVYPLPLVVVRDTGDLIIQSVSIGDAGCDNLSGSLLINAVSVSGKPLMYFIKSGNDTLSQTSNGLFTHLEPGTYYSWVSDSSGCTSVYPSPVIISELTAPTVISAVSTPETGTLSNGTITIIVNGQGLIYSLNGGAGVGSSSFTGLQTGSYSVKITNISGCDTTLVIYVGYVPGIRLEAIAGDGSACFGNVVVLPLLANRFSDVGSFSTRLMYDKSLVICQNYLNAEPRIADSLEVYLLPATGELEMKWKGKNPVSLTDGTRLLELSFASVVSGQGELLWDLAPGVSVFRDSLGSILPSEFTPGEVRVYSVPQADINTIQPVCDGGSTVLAASYLPGSGNGVINYHWTGPGGFERYTALVPLDSLTINDAGTYTLLISDTNQCKNEYTVQLVVVPQPETGFTADTIFFDEQIKLEAAPGYSRYVWNTGDTTASVLVAKEGSYTVTILTAEGCTTTDSVMMLYSFVPLSMPNAFHPDGDSKNDFFRPVTIPEKISSFSMYLYDRWGKLLFFTNDPVQGWDGTDGGSPAPPGSYVYVLKYGNPSGEQREKRGVFTLVR